MGATQQESEKTDKIVMVVGIMFACLLFMGICGERRSVRIGHRL